MAATLAVAADVALTGALHVDGLADTADGVLPHLDRDRRLAVMAEPDVGAFGVTAVVLTLGLRVAVLASLRPDVALLAALWCASRTLMAVTARSVPYARPQGGLAAAFLGRSPLTVALVGTVLAAAIAVFATDVGPAHAVAALAALVAAGAGVVALARHRLGGFTGDVLGAAGIVGETVGPPRRRRPLVTARARRPLGAAAGIVLDLALGEPPAAAPPPGGPLRLLHARRRRPPLPRQPGRGRGPRHRRRHRRAPSPAPPPARPPPPPTWPSPDASSTAPPSTSPPPSTPATSTAARAQLPALAGRDATDLDEPEMARAVVESVAENTVDAVVAPALWAAVLGGAGALGYRAVNTLDSMVGHRSDRYRRYGWASARLDDAANWLPARATAALVAAVRPHHAADVWRTVRRDAPAHPSPNAGVAEAAFAAALGLRLGGVNRYGDRVEHRAPLGRGRPPDRHDIHHAVRLSRDVSLALAVALPAISQLQRRLIPSKDHGRGGTTSHPGA